MVSHFGVSVYASELIAKLDCSHLNLWAKIETGKIAGSFRNGLLLIRQTLPSSIYMFILMDSR